MSGGVTAPEVAGPAATPGLVWSVGTPAHLDLLAIDDAESGAGATLARPGRVLYYFVDPPVAPSLLVDVSGFLDTKMRAPRCHASEFLPPHAPQRWPLPGPGGGPGQVPGGYGGAGGGRGLPGVHFAPVCRPGLLATRADLKDRPSGLVKGRPPCRDYRRAAETTLGAAGRRPNWIAGGKSAWGGW